MSKATNHVWDVESRIMDAIG